MGSFERYLEIRNFSEQQRVGEWLLPNKINLGIKDEQEAEALYSIGSSLWNDVFTSANVEDTLTGISHSPSSYSPEIHQRLKLIRLGGVILRDLNMLFSLSHKNPEPFYQFIKIFGSFNDNFGKELAVPTPEDVLGKMDTYCQEKENNNFVPSSAESFNTFIKGKINYISGYLDRNIISREELHSLKKANRLLLSYFLTKIFSRSASHPFNTYTYIRKIHTSLSNSLDKPDSDLLNEEQIKIPESARRLLNNFIPRIVLSE